MSHIKTVSFGNFPVSFQNNGYLNATVVAAHFNRRVGNYLKSERTQEYISALAEKLSVTPKRATEDNQIVIIKQGGTEQGTWLHPKLAVDFARWLDPKFAVWCDEQIEQILSGSPKLETQTTIDERRGLVDAVKLLVARCGIDYSAAYRMVHQRFGVAHIDQIAAPLLPAAVAYVHSLMLHNGISGEVLDRLPATLPNLEPMLFHTLFCAEFIYQHDAAFRLFNRSLAAGISDHAKDAMRLIRATARHMGVNLPDHRYFDSFPWAGDAVEKQQYHRLCFDI